MAYFSHMKAILALLTLGKGQPSTCSTGIRKVSISEIPCGKTVEEWFTSWMFSTDGICTTKFLRSLILTQVSLCVFSSFHDTDIMRMGGLLVMALKKEKGAKLCVPLPLSDKTHAIGLGITSWIMRKY